MLIFASTHLLARPVGPDDIIMNFPTEMFEQAMKQAMINWTNSLASTANNTVKRVDADKIVHQFDKIYSLPGRIAQESRLLEYYFPWDPGGQKLLT